MSQTRGEGKEDTRLPGLAAPEKSKVAAETRETQSIYYDKDKENGKEGRRCEGKEQREGENGRLRPARGREEGEGRPISGWGKGREEDNAPGEERGGTQRLGGKQGVGCH